MRLQNALHQSHLDVFSDNVPELTPGIGGGKDSAAAYYSSFFEDDEFISDVEQTFPLTPVQRDILQEPIQWSKTELGLGRGNRLDLRSVVNTWKSLATHRKHPFPS